MERYIAVDSGKSATKFASYNTTDWEKKGYVLKGKFRTKIGVGNFEDDMLENNTFVAKFSTDENEAVYKIGNGALSEAEMETSKRTDIHKMCTLLAIAMQCSEDEVDEVHAAIGIPVKDFENVAKRNEYRNFILPDGEIAVTYKKSASAEPVTIRFRIISKHVYPETLGALFVDGVDGSEPTAIIDIGHLNINLSVYSNGTEPDQDYSLTDVLGGNNLVTGLSQELSSAFSLCDEKTTARVLAGPREERYLHPVRPNKRVEEESRELINRYLLKHVREIRKRCDGKRWPIEFMNLVFIGGTTAFLDDEIREVFGDNVIIPDEPEFANVLGFLRIMCGKLSGKMIAF